MTPGLAHPRFSAFPGGVDYPGVPRIPEARNMNYVNSQTQYDPPVRRPRSATAVPGQGMPQIAPDAQQHTTQFWWGGQMGMARGAVWSRSLS